MNTDLFGNPVPTSPLDIIRAFIRSVKQRGRGSFNAWRAREGIDSVPPHIGALVRAASEKAGLVIARGTTTAKIKASHGRLCQVWKWEGNR